MDDLEAKKREIEIMLAEYEQAIEEAKRWSLDWKRRNAGFKCVRAKVPREQR